MKEIEDAKSSVVLVVNAGSSSMKFMVFRMAEEDRMLCKGVIERIGSDKPEMTYERYDRLKVKDKLEIKDHEGAMGALCDKLIDADCGVLKSLKDVQAIGHRVVHGGEKMTESCLIDDNVRKVISECADLAPLHNPANLTGITACEKVFPGVPNVAVFDTAFHQSMPASSYLYALPYEYYEKYGIRKYGFHGTSHKYVAQATADYLKYDLSDLKLITCHLGNGSSVAAVERGKVVDTSMGMTPLPGMVMGTRSGDIDPAIILYLIRKGMTVDEVDNLLNKQSGLLGVGGINSGDMRDIVEAATEKKMDQAARALWMFVHRLTSYIGAYYTIMNGADAIVFTGGIGENSVYARARIVDAIGVLGCYLDETKNSVMGSPEIISDFRSKMKAIVMPTNEELMIARDTVDVLKK